MPPKSTTSPRKGSYAIAWNPRSDGWTTGVMFVHSFASVSYAQVSFE